MPNVGTVVVACLLIVCATYAAVAKVLPSEAYAAMLGSFATAIALVFQRNTIDASIKKSMRPPPTGPGDEQP